MKCERCNKNEATIIVIQISNGKPEKLHICDRCANEDSDENGFAVPISFQDFFQALLDIIGMEVQYNQYNNNNSENDETRCKVCGTTYSEFKSTGRLGCENCYKTFKPQLDTVLQNMQGSTSHIGKVPASQRDKYNTKYEIDKLRKELKEAVQIEDYEKAAKLRDQIKAIEKEE